jgi:hypothetical protein
MLIWPFSALIRWLRIIRMHNQIMRTADSYDQLEQKCAEWAEVEAKIRKLWRESKHPAGLEKLFEADKQECEGIRRSD